MGREFTIRKCNGVRVHHEKKTDTVTVELEKKSDGVRLDHGVRVHHREER